MELVREILTEKDAIKDKLSRIVFHGEGALVEASGFQGQLRACDRVLDLIVELANKEETGK
jgi:hypothetical protein